MAKKSNIKSLIKDLEKEELIEVIIELSKVSKQNDQFIRMFIQGSNKENLEQTVNDAKKKIELVFYRNGFPRDDINLKLARSFLADYSKLLKDFPDAIIDLKMFYVEMGVSLIAEYGDCSPVILNSMASVFSDVCRNIFKNSSCYVLFKDRLNEIEEKSSHVGYGFSDYIKEKLFELKDELGLYDDDENDENGQAGDEE